MRTFSTALAPRLGTPEGRLDRPRRSGLAPVTVAAGLGLGTLGVLALAHGTTGPEPLPGPQPGAGLEQMAPADVFAFLSFTGLERASDAAPQLDLWKLWREPETQRLLEGLVDRYAAVAAETPPDVLQQWEMVKSHFSGRVSLALGGLTLLWTDDGPVPVPGAVLSVDLGDQAAGFQQWFDGMLEQALPSMPHLVREEVEHAGTPVDVFTWSGGGPQFSLHVAFVDDLMLVGVNPHLIERCIDNRVSPAAATLAGSPAFRRARSKSGSATIAEAWLNVDAFSERIRGLIPDEWREACHTLGLDGAHALYWASGVEGGDGIDTMYVDAPAPRRGLLALSEGKQLSPDALALVPETAAYATACRLDLQQAWDLVWDALEDVAPAGKLREARAGVDQLEGQLGFEIRNGLLAALGDEFVLYGELPEYGFVPNVVASIGLRDAGHASSIVDRVLALCQADASAQEVPGGSLVTIRVPDSGLPFTPAYAFQGDRLLVSLTIPALREALRDGPTGSWLAGDKFARTFEGLDWKHACSLEYYDTERLVGFAYNMLQSFGPAAMGGHESPVDLALLPSQDVVLGHMRGWASVARADKDGLVVQARCVSLGSLMALVSHFLFTAPGAPPYVLENLAPKHQAEEKVVFAAPRPVAVRAKEDEPINPLRAGDPREAEFHERIAELTALIAEHPDQAELYFSRALALGQVRQHQEAIADYKTARLLDHRPAVCAYNIACSLSLESRPDEAIQWLSIALEEGFDNWSLIANDSDLDAIRGDERFVQLLEHEQRGGGTH